MCGGGGGGVGTKKNHAWIQLRRRIIYATAMRPITYHGLINVNEIHKQRNKQQSGGGGKI